MEGIIQAHPAVKGAIICGMGQFQSSLLVEGAEPPASDAERERLLDEIWPSVENANKESPSHGRIHRDMILFTTADRPMPRAGKGTAQRQATVALYKTDLDDLYAASEVASSVKGRDVALEEPADIPEAIRIFISGATEMSVDEIPPEANLFDFGLDSLQVATLVKTINKHLANLGKPLLMDQRLIYSNPSLNGLTDVVTALCKGNTPVSSGKTAFENMQHLYDLNVSHLPVTVRAPQTQAGEISVLLTGSTGSLGSYVLDYLIRESKVAHIFCLNRGPGSLDRQHKSQASKNLSALPPSKVTCLDGSLSQDYFGLTMEEYKTLLRSIGLVIHNAWQVNFNLPLESFSPHVESVRRLVEFSSHSRFGARIFFVSSISSVVNYDQDAASNREAVPEHIIEDWHVANDGGYGQSKLISERILDAAAKQAGTPTAVCRVGQIAGPTTAAGVWPEQEWLCPEPRRELQASGEAAGLAGEARPGGLDPRRSARPLCRRTCTWSVECRGAGAGAGVAVAVAVRRTCLPYGKSNSRCVGGFGLHPSGGARWRRSGRDSAIGDLGRSAERICFEDGERGGKSCYQALGLLSRLDSRYCCSLENGAYDSLIAGAGCFNTSASSMGGELGKAMVFLRDIECDSVSIPSE